MRGGSLAGIRTQATCWERGSLDAMPPGKPLQQVNLDGGINPVIKSQSSKAPYILLQLHVLKSLKSREG